MMNILTHPHGKPKEVTIKDRTHVMSGLRIVKTEEEIKLIKTDAKVADMGMEAKHLGYCLIAIKEVNIW